MNFTRTAISAAVLFVLYDTKVFVISDDIIYVTDKSAIISRPAVIAGRSVTLKKAALHNYRM